MNETDEAVYERFLIKRSEDDLRVLLERHRDGLLLFINGFVHDLNDAEEIMLDSFAETAVGRSVFHGRSSFRTWLFSIGKRKALMHLRKTKRLAAAQDCEARDDGEPPDLDILKRERNAGLYSALEKINPEYRRILILLYFEQMTHEEAARVMQKSRKQIYHLAERGKKALRQALEGMGYEYEEY
ncbi:MAG: RNA polymerase sigma factor [Clostridia bacterium]|nr:RNA polymerase sigma factor [Clostridia bacterium]